jgi:hypothetical protein
MVRKERRKMFSTRHREGNQKSCPHFSLVPKLVQLWRINSNKRAGGRSPRPEVIVFNPRLARAWLPSLLCPLSPCARFSN